VAQTEKILKSGRVVIYRHPVLVRLTHWVMVLSMLALLPSGLEILNSHPAFYLGEASQFETPLLAIDHREDDSGNLHGFVRLGSVEINTTGLLGASRDSEGSWQARAIPAWATLPSYHDLGAARRWHFFFAWMLAASGFVYLLSGIVSGRLWREVLPKWRDLSGVGRSILDHLRRSHPEGEAARHYNPLQKLAYGAVIVGLFPLVILTGMAMSPGLDASLPGLTQVFGGRQTARTLHFVGVIGLSGFVLIHLIMVIVAGPLNEMRSILSGWYKLPADRKTST
jgi:thiosulfate reductase cytochrome b subunit